MVVLLVSKREFSIFLRRKYSVGERSVSLTNDAGKLDVHMQKNETGPYL